MENKVFKVKVTNPEAWGGLGEYYGKTIEVRHIDGIYPERDPKAFYKIVSKVGFECIMIKDCRKVQTHNVIGGQLYDDGTTPETIRDRERSSRSR